jgi:sugar phosphate isomerase/epimerase
MSTRPIGLFTDAFPNIPREAVFEQVSALGMSAVEIGTGGFSPAPHATAASLLDDRERDRLERDAANAGVQITAFNCSGNPLFPDRLDAQSPDDVTLRQTLTAAHGLGVERVVCMSGCPIASPAERSRPAFLPVDWLPQDRGAADWQWSERVVPYWLDLLAFAAREAPDVRICLELDPGQTIFTPRGFLRLVDDLGDAATQLAVNLDPSHLFWQLMDPLEATRLLGNRVGYAHAKDTVVDLAAMSANGVLAAPYRYATVGAGHGVDWWATFCRELGDAGYHGPISVEWEDGQIPADVSVALAVSVLVEAVGRASEAVDVG